MDSILFYATNILMALAYILYLLLLLINNRDSITGTDGFNITNDALNDDSRINIVERKGYITFYNIKRKIIEIASKSYYGKTITDVSIPLIELGVYGVDDGKHKSLNFLRQLLPSIKIICIFPILALFINNVTYNLSDARIGVIALTICVLLEYILINIKSEGINYVTKSLKKVTNISKKHSDKIIKFLNNDLLITRLIYASEFLMLLRVIWIIISFYQK